MTQTTTFLNPTHADVRYPRRGCVHLKDTYPPIGFEGMLGWFDQGVLITPETGTKIWVPYANIGFIESRDDD